MIIHRRKTPPKTNKRNYTEPDKPRYADLSLGEKPQHPGESFWIVSYNIKYSKRIERAIKLFEKNKDLKNADVICLQEMTGEAVPVLAKALKYNYVFYPAVFHPVLRKDFGNAVLSRWPIIEDHKIIMPHLDPRRSQRTAVNAVIDFHGRPILVCSIHFKVLLKAALRADQMQKLLGSLPDDKEHVVIAGDFNTFTKKNNKAILEPLVNADFIPATAGLGWSHKHWTLMNKKSQLDHIFIKGLDILQTGKVIDRKSSDHIPIWAQLTFPKETYGENI